MPVMPAVCYSCHTIFSSNLFVRDIRMNLSGLEINSCPICEKKGRIIGGMYEFIDYTLTVLKNVDYSVDKMDVLYEMLIDAQGERITPEQLKHEIKQRFPESIDLLLLLPETNEDYDLCVNIMEQVLLSAMELSMSEQIRIDQLTDTDSVKIMKNLKVEQIIDHIYSINTGVTKRFI